MSYYDQYEKKHRSLLSEIDKRIKDLYREAIGQMAILSAQIDPTAYAEMVSWSFGTLPPWMQSRIDEIMATLHDEIEVCVTNGIDAHWQLSNERNDKLCERVFGAAFASLSESQVRRYLDPNAEALEAFKRRKTNGFDLSQRIWRYVEGFRADMESIIEDCIRQGKSADEMSRAVRSHLNQPSKLFRRVRDKDGNLVLSSSAKAYHPGRGVYRSSYMNARRLAVTENNIAYRTADHLRVQKLDFVVGIRIVLSNNHNCKGVPRGMFFDICDELQGKYPKDFMFTGWHPHCRCHVETILKTPEEMESDNRRIMEGRRVYCKSENKVTRPPKGLDKWIKENAERIGTSKHQPYFIRDNKKYFEKA